MVYFFALGLSRSGHGHTGRAGGKGQQEQETDPERAGVSLLTCRYEGIKPRPTGDVPPPLGASKAEAATGGKKGAGGTEHGDTAWSAP